MITDKIHRLLSELWPFVNDNANLAIAGASVSHGHISSYLLLFLLVVLFLLFLLYFLFCCYLFPFVVGGGGGGGGFGHTDSFNTKMFRSALVMAYAFVFSTAYCSVSSPNGMHVNYYDFLSLHFNNIKWIHNI